MRVTSSFNLRRRRLVEASIGAAALSLAGVPLPSFAEEQGPVSIRDSRGVHEFRKIPQRVVALQWDILENLVGLGIRPVGAADIAPWSEWVREPALPEGIVNVGTRAEPNLERIAELKPDLILIGPTQEDLLAQLNGIAPVLLFENYRAESVEGEAETAIAQFRELAKLLRAEDRAESEIARIESGLAELGEKVKNAFGTSPQVQVIRFSSLTTLFLYTPNSICDYALKKMGIRQPLELPNASYGLTQVRIRDLKNLTDAYVIYIRPFAMEKKVLNSILWCATPFARKGRVAAAEPYWSHGGAPSILVTARRITDALLTLAPGAGQ